MSYFLLWLLISLPVSIVLGKALKWGKVEEHIAADE